MFPERFQSLKEADCFQKMIEIMKEDLKKQEWESDPYDLREGWMSSAFSLCLAICFPEDLQKALRSAEREDLPEPELSELYLAIINY